MDLRRNNIYEYINVWRVGTMGGETVGEWTWGKSGIFWGASPTSCALGWLTITPCLTRPTTRLLENHSSSRISSHTDCDLNYLWTHLRIKSYVQNKQKDKMLLLQLVVWNGPDVCEAPPLWSCVNGVLQFVIQCAKGRDTLKKCQMYSTESNKRSMIYCNNHKWLDAKYYSNKHLK